MVNGEFVQLAVDNHLGNIVFPPVGDDAWDILFNEAERGSDSVVSSLK